ncbi:InlB B-repeat-containing protein, partial [Collinsella tanakaei]|uniref:InlB B-repeat-containing protein n=1 Tax=Collinsella tanakaei TaxID=626935 RepID=UPI00195CB976
MSIIERNGAARLAVVAGLGVALTFGAAPSMALAAGSDDSASLEQSADPVGGDLGQTSESEGNSVPQAEGAVTMTQGDGTPVQYGSISAALAAVQPYDYKTNKDAYVIALNDDVSEDVVIPVGVNVTIDLAGHKLANASGHTITNNSTKTVIKDSSAEKSGVVDNTAHGRGAVYNNINASITLKGGTFMRSAEASKAGNDAGGNSWYVLKNFGTMTVSDGVTVKFSDSNPGHYSSLIGNGWQSSSEAEAGTNGEPKPSEGKSKAALNINGGKFFGGKITVKNDDYGVLKVAGGSITQSTGNYYAIYNANKATISGGTISAISCAIGSEHFDGDANEGSLTVSGGTIRSEEDVAVSLLGGAIATIKGGSFESGSGKHAISADDGSEATITAGTFVVDSANLVANKDGFFAERFGVEQDEQGNFVTKVTDAVATVVDADGNVTSYETLAKAFSNAPAGSTIKLQEDVKLTSTVATENYGVRVDLNGHNVSSTGTSKAVIQLNTKYGRNPEDCADPTMRLVNSVQGQGGIVSGALPLSAKAGDSNYHLAVEVGEGITLAPTDPSADSVKLESSAYLKYSAQAAGYIKNGGFKVTAKDGDRIYGAYANAAGVSVDGTVTMLNDYVGSAQINSGDYDATLDLDGHAYTYTGGEAIADVNYDGASLTIRNGALKATDTEADGVHMLYSNSDLILDDVMIEVPGGPYGIVTNGMQTNNNITLKNSSLVVSEGSGIYFPSTGSVTIDNSSITAKNTGVQVCAGSLTIQGGGTAITVTGTPSEKVENDGAIPDGAAVSIVKRDGYQDLDNVTVAGGTFVSTVGVAPVVKAYTFNNTEKKEGEWPEATDVVDVSGGSFSSPVEGLVIESLKAELRSSDGMYSYFPSVEDALAAAKPGDEVSSLEDSAETADEVKVTFDYGYDGGKATLVVAKGSKVKLPVPTRAGYTFRGWADGVGAVHGAGTEYQVSDGVTLTAQWTKNYVPPVQTGHKVTVADAEGGEVKVVPTSAKKGDTVTIAATPDEGMKVAGVTVKGADGKEVEVEAGEKDGTWTFEMPGSAVTVEVAFADAWE